MTLDAHQIEAAIQFVTEHWPDQPMLPAERAEWADALAYFRKGELSPAIERWATPTRPSAGAVLDYVLTNRETPPPAPRPIPEPDLGGKYTPVVVDAIRQAREALGQRFDEDLVPCAPDPR